MTGMVPKTASRSVASSLSERVVTLAETSDERRDDAGASEGVPPSGVTLRETGGE